MSSSEIGSRLQLVSQPPAPAPARIVYADTKATRAAHQLVIFGSGSSIGGEESSDPSRTTLSDSSQVVESPTEDGIGNNENGYAFSEPEEMSPTTHRTSMSEVRRMRGQLSNLMREVARIRDERVPARMVIESSEALPMYEEARSRVN